MLEMATKNSDNPVRVVVSKMIDIQEDSYVNKIFTKKLVMPGKLMIPSSLDGSGDFSMLGLGDIVMPGVLISFLYSEPEFHSLYCISLIGYLVGLITATVMVDITGLAQPALLYLVPSVILSVLVRAKRKNLLKKVWNGTSTTLPK